MTRFLWQFVLMTAVLAMVFAGGVQATPITWYFSGELTYVDGLPADITVGMPFNGSFTYEPPIPDSLPDSDTKAVYHVGAAAMQVQIGEHQIISGTENQMNVYSSDSNDRVWVISLDFDTPFGVAHEWDYSFTDLDSEIFSSTDLPVLPPPLSPLEQRIMHVNGSGFLIGGVVNELTPEPTSATLLIAASCWLSLRRHRSRPRG